MKNLENLGVLELSAQESKEVEGGLFGIDDAALALAIGIAMAGAYVIDNFDRLVEGVADGYNAT